MSGGPFQWWHPERYFDTTYTGVDLAKGEDTTIILKSVNCNLCNKDYLSITEKDTQFENQCIHCNWSLNPTGGI